MRAKKKNFQKLSSDSTVWKNIFKYSSGQNEKLIDYRDLILKVGKHTFIAITVFSKHEPKKEEIAN